MHAKEKDDATAKAKDIVRMSVARTTLLEPLEEIELPMDKGVLVIGGGVAGMTSALNMAEQGFEIYLLEKEDDLGGMARRIHTTLEGVDVQAYLADLTGKVYRHPSIHVVTDAVIEEVAGYVGNFTTRVRSEGRIREIRHGVAVIATGAEEHKPAEYLYGESDQVLTLLELEGRIAAPEAWAPVSLDLAPLSGEEVWIKAAMEVQGEAPGALLIEPPFLSTQASAAPTVLLITSDTHRADVLGVADSEFEVNTPNLDALASRGVRFVDCLSSTNVTSPSHVAIMTGTPPRDSGIITNTGHMASAALTVAERFREHGYMTFAVASVRHLGPLGTGLGQCFDRIAAPRSEVWDAEVSLDVLESWLPDAEGRPLFAWLHLFDAHAPYGPPGEFDGRYYPEDKDPFSATAHAEAELHPRWLNGAIQGLKDPEFAVTQYRAEVDYLDQQLGRLLNLPRFKAGVTAFTADHGESFGGGGVWFSHVGLFPETLHVPLLLSWPGGPEGAVVDSPVEHINLGRTLLDLSGFQADDFPGRSLLGAVEGEVSTQPRFSFSANGKCAAVIHEGWQLTLNLRKHDYHGLLTRSHHQVELFRISSDPGCLVDLVDEEREQAARLRRMLVAWLVDTRGSSLARSGNEDADALAQLAALGYTMDVPETDDRGWFELDCDCQWCGRFDG